MAKLIQETGGGSRTVRRADGTMDSYGRTAMWRVRYVVAFPDGSRAIRSKVAGRRNEAGQFERLTRTGNGGAAGPWTLPEVGLDFSR